MKFKLSEMSEWERKKAIFLMGVAEELGISLNDCYGEVAVNDNSGFVYVWSEDYNFSLYMPIKCELKKSDVCALWTNSNNGDEKTFNLKENTTLQDIEEWASVQEQTQINQEGDKE